MQLRIQTYLRFLLSLVPLAHSFTLGSINRPTCADPPLDNPPKLSDCEHVMIQIQQQMAESGNPLGTASRRTASNLYLPILYWDHLPESTCGIKIDMITGKEDASDEVRLSDIAYAAESVMSACLTPGNIPQLTEGWMRIGRRKYVNITVERLLWEPTNSGRSRVLRLTNETLATGSASSVNFE